jgi:rhamnose transport system permease protein
MTRYVREISVALAYLLLLLVLAVAAPSFYESNKLRTIAVDNAAVLVLAVGMTLAILCRHIDISIGAQFALCAVAAGLLAKAGLPMALVVVLILLAGAALGAVNGALVAGLGLPSIVVTLATFFIFREALRWWRSGESVNDLPPTFQWLGLGQDDGQAVVVGTALAVFAAAALGLRYLAAGRAIYATGSDPVAAWLVGVRPRRVVFGVFVVMGVLSGLAALLNGVRFPDVGASTRPGLELQVIAAVVVGGVSVAGGRGTLVGPLLGVALLGTLVSALIFLGLPPHWSRAIQGGIIVVAVAGEALNRRRSYDARTRLARA